jgi:hypothetical protein
VDWGVDVNASPGQSFINIVGEVDYCNTALQFAVQKEDIEMVV